MGPWPGPARAARRAWPWAHRPIGQDKTSKPSKTRQAKQARPTQPKPSQPIQPRPGQAWPRIEPRGQIWAPGSVPQVGLGVGGARPKFRQNPDRPEMAPHGSVWPLNRGKRTAVPFRTQIFHPIFGVGPPGPPKKQEWPGGLGEFPGHWNHILKAGSPEGPIGQLFQTMHVFELARGLIRVRRLPSQPC